MCASGAVMPCASGFNLADRRRTRGQELALLSLGSPLVLVCGRTSSRESLGAGASSAAPIAQVISPSIVVSAPPSVSLCLPSEHAPSPTVISGRTCESSLLAWDSLCRFFGRSSGNSAIASSTGFPLSGLGPGGWGAGALAAASYCSWIIW